MRKKELYTVILSAALTIVFTYAALLKLADLEEFSRQLHKQKLPEWSKGLLVWFIPLVELALSTLLLYPSTRRWGFYGALSLMALFTGYMAWVVWAYQDSPPCSCAGIIPQASFQEHLAFNCLFLGFAIAGSLLEHKKTKSSQDTQHKTCEMRSRINISKPGVPET